MKKRNRNLLIGIAALALAMVFAMSCAPKKTEQQLAEEIAQLEAAEAEQAEKIAALEAELAAAQAAPKPGLTDAQKKEQEAKAAELAKQLASAQTELAKTEDQKQKTAAQNKGGHQGGGKSGNQGGGKSGNQGGGKSGQQDESQAEETENTQPSTLPPEGFEMNGGALTKYTGKEANITLPSTVTEIGYRAFRNNNSLTSITIPASVTSIGTEAFSNCSNLLSVTFEGAIAAGNFKNNAFPGDLHDKYFADEAGTYTRLKSSDTWEKQ